MKKIYSILLTTIVIVALVVLITQKDAIINTQDSIYKIPSYLNIREIDVKPMNVTSSLVDINITAYINHDGGRTNNATMLIRAVDSDTRLLSSQISAYIPETDLQKTLIVSQNLKIERIKNYDLNILLFDNGSIVDSGSVSIRGLNSLTPQSKATGITMSNIDFFVGGVSADKVVIKPEIYLENTWEETSENLKLIVKAREADSNILADRINAETGAIKSEATIIKEVQLNVPDGYNYMVIVELWKDDTLINSWEKPILLAPTKTIPKESQERKINIEVSKFVRETPTEGMAPGVKPTEASAYPSATPREPGFEIISAFIAILVVLLIKKRWSK